MASMATEMQKEIQSLPATMILPTTNMVSDWKVTMWVWCLHDTLILTGRFDASALHIAHALKQTEIQKSYNKAREKPIDEYLVRKL